MFLQYALKRRISSGSEREHWLDYAKEKYDSRVVEDVKCLLKVLWMYIPLPMFWALFDQLVKHLIHGDQHSGSWYTRILLTFISVFSNLHVLYSISD